MADESGAIDHMDEVMPADEMGEEEYFGEEEYMMEEGGEEMLGSREFEGEEEAQDGVASPTRTEMDREEMSRRNNEVEITKRFIHSTLMENINDARQRSNLPAFYENLGLVSVAHDYAHYFSSDRGDEATPNPAMAEPKARSAGYKEEP